MRSHIASGDKYLAEGKLAEAIIEYRNAVQQQPNSGPARTKLGDAYLKAGDAPRAFPELIRAADLLPADANAQVKAGNLLLLAGKFDDGRARAQKAIDIDPKNLGAHILLANTLAGLKDVEAAIAQVEEAITLNPGRGATYSQLGVLELGRGQAEAAERAFKKATEIDPRSVNAHLALANFYWVTGRAADAEGALKAGLQVEPDNLAANRALGAFYIGTNRAPDAEAYLKKVAEVSKAPAASLALADYYVGSRNDAQAIAVLEPMTKEPRTAADAGVRLATIDYRQGRKKEAYARLDGILANDSKHLQASLLKAELLLAENKPDEALPIATALVEQHKNSVPALFVLGRVQAERREADAAIKSFEEVLRLNPRATQAKLALAQVHLTRGQAETSVMLAEEAVRSQPQNVQAKLVLIQGLMSRGELKRAEAELLPLLKQYPTSALILARMGMLRAMQSNLPEARKYLDRATEISPDSMDALGGQVALDIGTKRVEDAKRRVDARLQRGNVTGPLLMLAARTYAAAGDEKGTEELLRRAVQTDPGLLQAYAALGQLYVKQKRLDVARTEFETLAKRDPKPAGALTMLGTLEQMQGNGTAAKAHYERALEADPEAAVAANNLAWMYATQGGNLDVALQLAQTAKRRLPDHADVNDTLGYVYYKKDLSSQAIAAFKASLTKEPNSAVYHSHIGLAYAKAGDVANARQHLSTAFKLQPTFEGAAEAKKVLDSLPPLQ